MRGSAWRNGEWDDFEVKEAAGWAELAGSGMLKIMTHWTDAGYQKPLIKNDTPRGWFTLEMPLFEENSEKSMNTTQEIGETTQKNENTTQEIIIGLLKEQPEITRAELAGKTGITPDGVKYHLDKLRKEGRIHHVGPTKKGKWEVL